ncbi:MAG: hypothetical protein ABWW69_03210 [Pyrodictiaceae archaeon]
MAYMLREDSLIKLVRRARERWEDFQILRVVQKRNKQIIYARAQGYPLKALIYSDGRVRVFSPLGSTSIAFKRMIKWVLGIEQ